MAAIIRCETCIEGASSMDARGGGGGETMSAEKHTKTTGVEKSDRDGEIGVIAPPYSSALTG